MTPFERGCALLTEHRLDEALEAFERILVTEPAHVDALYHASLVHAARKRYQPSLSHAIRVAELRPDWWRGPAQAGALLLVLERPAEALRYLERAAALNLASAEVFNNIGCCQRALGRRADALKSFERAAELAPDDAAAVCNLADAFSNCGRLDESVETLQGLIERGVVDANICDLLGKALWKSGKLDEGLVWFDRAIALDPNCATAHGHRGNALIERGDIAEGLQCLRTAIDIQPLRAEFYRVLAEADPSSLADADLALLQDLDGGDAAFAIARVLESRGERKAAFPYLLAANADVRANLVWDEATVLGGIERLATVFHAERFRTNTEAGNPSDRPVFIVGMPRSGTTLIEQVLSSHPNVHGAGELPLFTQISDWVVKQAGIAPEAVPDNSSVIRQVGDAYVAKLAELAPSDALRVTDKMPDNFRAVGLIALALPNARIIHACRDALDTCLSCFSITFEAQDLAWTYDLGELGRYYRTYADLMKHWHAVLPNKILDVHYEAMVDDLETQARRIVEFCGLPWDDACLAFYENKRPIKTASVTQVRKPIYRSSVKRAEGYGDLLKPLIEQLRA